MNFSEHIDWIDFTRRWIAERERRGLPPTWNRLAVTMQRAQPMPPAIAIALAQACLTIVHAPYAARASSHKPTAVKERE